MGNMSKSDPWMRGMFDSASPRYALLNRILTFGQDEIWRQNAVDTIEPQNKDRILDICTGTADLALKIAKKFPELPIHVLDYSPRMLATAKKRARGLAVKNIIFKEGDCTNMEFDNDYFDYITISFGFRNLSYSRENLDKALKEIRRVLKQGGRFIILETSQPSNILIRRAFHFYAARIVPLLGRLFSGRKEPYAYLGNSIVRFFNKDELTDALEAVGFKKEKIAPFMCGMILLCVVQK